MCFCLQGPLVDQLTIPVAHGFTSFNASFRHGLTANTDYLLRLIAVDTAGNCQHHFTDLPVHTLDNIPPVTVAFSIMAIGGTFAGLQLTLDEPSNAFYTVLPKGTACPSVDVLFAVGAGVLPSGAVAAGNFSVPLGNAPAVVNITGLTSETDYSACVVVSDITRLQNKQAAAIARDFRTLDITPPVLSVSIMAGNDGNFTCDRCVG